jgi:hypothetical protein
MQNELRILKLITGEEIVGNITERGGGLISIENPCLLGIAMGPNGKASLQMQPMLIFSEQKVVELQLNHVIYNISVAQEIQNRYNEIYGSGIVMPKKQSIII